MKRIGNLWEKIVTEENIELAYQKARKGKSSRRFVHKVQLNKKELLDKLRTSLNDGTFTTSPYKIKKIYEPKERDIFILPFYPDRIVQHAIMNVIAPIWDNRFYHHSYACRIGKGQHAASRYIHPFVKQYQYYLQGDIRKFYPSINHEIMMSIVSEKIKDKKVLALFSNIINSIPGNTNVPIGNYTSQWLGNLYLNKLDSYITRNLPVHGYTRYNDDFCIFANSKEDLNVCKEKIRQFLKNHLALSLSKEHVTKCSLGIDFVGYRHFPKYILIRKKTVKRVKNRIDMLRYQVQAGLLSESKLSNSLASTFGWLKHANSRNLTDTILQSA